MRRGDVVTAVDGTTLKDDWSFTQALNKHEPGDTVTLSLLHGKQALSVRVTLAERPAP